MFYLAGSVEENQAALAQSGHWGVPTFVFEGEAFWGQDRIDDLERALRKAAQTRRLGAAA